MHHVLRYILLTGILCWLSLSVAGQEPNATVIPMSSTLNLRVVPAVNGAVIVELAGETPLFVVARSADNRWYQAQTMDGQAGWVAAAYVRLTVERDSLPVVSIGAEGRGAVPATNPGVAFVPARPAGDRLANFAKVGDSITYSELFMHPIGYGHYQLGGYGHLQGVIDYFMQDENSFARQSMASGNGWTTETVLNPAFANRDQCMEGESPLACEYRITRPVAALIMLGSNDVAWLSLDVYAHNLGLIVSASLEQGVVPVISTIPYRVGYEAQVEAANGIVRSVAATYRVPVWDYFGAMASLPNLGLSDDGLHPSIPSAGFLGAADFSGEALSSGYTVRNLTALQVLYQVLNSRR